MIRFQKVTFGYFFALFICLFWNMFLWYGILLKTHQITKLVQILIEFASTNFILFQIFQTPEGMLSSEQGIYVAESVASKNMKQAKGRYRVYEDEDDEVFLDINSSLAFSVIIFVSTVHDRLKCHCYF